MLVNAVHIVEKFFTDIFVNQFDWWVILGFVAQLMFTGRFLVQWIASEREGKSVIPIAFWLFSIAGGVLLFAYALYRRDPVFILGQAFGVFVYARNLYLVVRERKNIARKAPARS
ncbi:MAG TPA: lipid-A-disaccharide synthase N-terminal domain-containing protein [Xanthobacteraceae bacterium]|nr:lipid-A-disaccharide synthase N-terminal domain-containing protein [Xanthobacteraceae bacterium]